MVVCVDDYFYEVLVFVFFDCLVDMCYWVCVDQQLVVCLFCFCECYFDVVEWWVDVYCVGYDLVGYFVWIVVEQVGCDDFVVVV